MDVAIIIINYNTLALTRQCLESVFRFTSGLSFEVVLVDNASTEAGVETLQDEFPLLKLVKSERNLGFAGGNNLGIQHCNAEYILLLNSDTYLTDNAIYTTWCFIKDKADAGAVSCRLVFPDGRHQSVAQRFPSVKYQLIELLRLQKLCSRRKAGQLLLGAFFDHEETTEVDWVWGAFFMFRSAILEELDGAKLDDTYFMYWEDIQWCMDIKRRGYTNYFYAGATVVHLLGGSSAKKNELMETNGALFLKRNYTAMQRLLIRKLQQWLG